MLNACEIQIFNGNKKYGNHHLVGSIPTPLKNMKVSWDDSSQCTVYGKIK